MIDTTGKCSACGQTVGIDTIHTCSPQVTAPTPERRVGEADVFVPRMPSSVVQDEINYCAHKLDRTFRDEVDLRTYLYICQDWQDLRAAVARLSAEVERLTKELRSLTHCDCGRTVGRGAGGEGARDLRDQARGGGRREGAEAVAGRAHEVGRVE